MKEEFDSVLDMIREIRELNEIIEGKKVVPKRRSNNTYILHDLHGKEIIINMEIQFKQINIKMPYLWLSKLFLNK